MPWDHFAFIRWIRKCGLPPTERHMLHALASRSDWQTGETFASHGRLADDTGMHRSTVVRALGQLVKKGHLSIVERHGRTCTYMLHRATETSHDATETSHSATCSRERHVAESDNNVAQCDRSVAESDSRCSRERHYRPSYRPKDRPSEVAGATPAQDSNRATPAGEPPAPHAAFARPDPSPEIAARIRSHRIFARLNADRLAETNAHHVETGGKKLEWVLAAIDSCAADADAAESTPAEEGERWSEGHKARMLSRYIRKASARDMPEPVDDPDGPSIPSNPLYRNNFDQPNDGPVATPKQIRAALAKMRFEPKYHVPDLSEQRKARRAKAAGGKP